MLNTHGWEVSTAGNPSVLSLFRAADPQKHYVKKMIDLDRCIGDIVEKKTDFDLCVVFAHNDAGISYAATMHHISRARLVVVVFGRDADTLGNLIEFPCERIVERAVHNPNELKRKVNEVFGWHASTN
jgi:threonyl-tRNA synthetase